MTATITLDPTGISFAAAPGETLLDAALAAGVGVGYGCSNGNCGACRARLVAGEAIKLHPHDFTFSQADKDRGALLLCAYGAADDLVIEAEDAVAARDIPAQTLACKVNGLAVFDDGIAVLDLVAPRSQRLRFLAGQSARLTFENQTTLALPIGSCPCDGRKLQFHAPTDMIGPAIAAGRRRQIVLVDGPRGDFHLRRETGRSLIFVADGAGFGPIKGVVEHALERETTAPMVLIRIDDGGLPYLDNLCRAWADAFDNLVYLRVPDHGAARRTVRDWSDLCGTDLYWVGRAVTAAEIGIPPGQFHHHSGPNSA